MRAIDDIAASHHSTCSTVRSPLQSSSKAPLPRVGDEFSDQAIAEEEARRELSVCMHFLTSGVLPTYFTQMLNVKVSPQMQRSRTRVDARPSSPPPGFIPNDMARSTSGSGVPCSQHAGRCH